MYKVVFYSVRHNVLYISQFMKFVNPVVQFFDVILNFVSAWFFSFDRGVLKFQFCRHIHFSFQFWKVLLTYLLYLFIFWKRHAAWGILLPPTGMEPRLPAAEAWSPNNWTTRKFPILPNILKKPNKDIVKVFA